MELHDAALTISVAAAAGIGLVVIAHRVGVPAIAFLLVAGVALGPSGVGLVQPAALGSGLSTVVALAVAVILFEGGLTLDVGGYRGAPKVIQRMLTIGVLVTWLGAALAAHLIFDLSYSLAVTAGSLVIVTGPTVIAPLLRRIDVKPRLHHILYWEGVLIDAVGVFIAVLCFEWLLARDAAHSLSRLGLRVIVGSGLGLLAGFFTAWSLDRDWLEDEHANAFVLSIALVTFSLSNAALHESGILAVVVAGLVIALRKPRRLDAVKRFKLELTELGIGVVFILLSAKLDLKRFVEMGPALITFVLVVAFVVRPLNIAVSTVGQGLGWRERAFLSWIAPRGIVAASMASLFALDLSEKGFEGATALETLTYAVIAATVLLQGLSAPLVARLLGVRRTDRPGWLIHGDALATPIAKALVKAGVPSAVWFESEGERARFRSHDIPAFVEDDHDAPELADFGHILCVHDDNQTCSWNRFAPIPGVMRQQMTHTEHMGREVSSGERIIDVVPHRESDPRFCEGFLPLLTVEKGHAAAVMHPGAPLSAEQIVVGRTRIPGLQPLVAKSLVLECSDLSDALGALLEASAADYSELDPNDIRSAMLEREQSLSTAVGNGVAIPHAVTPAVDQSRCWIGSIPDGIALEGPDGAQVHLLLMLLSPPDAPTGHLNALATLARLASDERLVERLGAATTPDALDDIVAERA